MDDFKIAPQDSSSFSATTSFGGRPVVPLCPRPTVFSPRIACIRNMVRVAILLFFTLLGTACMLSSAGDEVSVAPDWGCGIISYYYRARKYACRLLYSAWDHVLLSVSSTCLLNHGFNVKKENACVCCYLFPLGFIAVDSSLMSIWILEKDAVWRKIYAITNILYWFRRMWWKSCMLANPV